MSNVTTTARPQLAGATTPKIYNLELTLADTEYEQALSSSVKKLTVSARGMTSPIKLAYEAAPTEYLSIGAGASYSEDALNFTGSIFLQSSKAGTVVEIVEWT